MCICADTRKAEGKEILKMEEVCSFETWVFTCKTTLFHNSEGYKLNNNLRDNLKTEILKLLPYILEGMETAIKYVIFTRTVLW
jgi:hypothetical protein